MCSNDGTLLVRVRIDKAFDGITIDDGGSAASNNKTINRPITSKPYKRNGTIYYSSIDEFQNCKHRNNSNKSEFVHGEVIYLRYFNG